MRELILSIRADESRHREVNHHFADLPSWGVVEHENVQINKEENTLTFTSLEEKSSGD